MQTQDTSETDDLGQDPGKKRRSVGRAPEAEQRLPHPAADVDMQDEDEPMQQPAASPDATRCVSMQGLSAAQAPK